MPAMNLRLISPELIVDIGELAELRGIAVSGDVLTIGALTRHVDLLKIARNRRARAAVDRSHRPCRASRDPQQGHDRRQPRACRSGVRTAGLHGRAGCDHHRPRPDRRAADSRPRISSPGFMRRRCRRRNCWLRSSCRSRKRIPRISSTNSPGGTAITPSSASRRRRSWKATCSTDLRAGLLCGRRSAGTGQGREQSLLKAPSRRRCCRKHRQAWARNSIRPEDQQASASMRRHLAKVLLARCVSALLGRPDLVPGDLA